jgi:SNARE domain
MQGIKGTYRQVGLDEFSDDDSDHDVPHLNSSSRNGAVGGGGSNSSSSNHGGPASSSSSFAGGSMQRQQELMVRQDQGLEMLAQSAERLGQMSMTISDELNQQNKMLDEMDTDLDTAGENLDYVTKKTKEFIDKAGGTKNCLIIAALAGIVVVLFFLILYT